MAIRLCNQYQRARSGSPTWLLLTLGLLLSQAASSAEEYFDCVVDPARIIKLSSPVIGLLAEVSVSRGDKVARDQVIARLDSAVEVRNTALKRAQAKATAAAEVRKERLALSRKSLERASRLANDAALTRQRIDELESEVRVNERELAMARFQ
ncbi:MAG: biotin/lipoyl-binding protein, partial [bacterium]|nr:biotin/lipoyl-binding protein [bacterium]